MGPFDIAAYELQRDELSERLQRLNDDLEKTVSAIRRAEAERYRLEGRIAVLIEQGAAPTANRHKKRTALPLPSPRVANPNKASVTDAALALISEAGRPLTRSELYATLTERGLKLAGKDPLMVFSTMLWREKKRIKRLRGFGYWPADKPYAPAEYDPGVAQPNLL